MKMPDSPTDAAFQCAFLVDDALNAYIAIQDQILKEQGTFGSMVRNAFGRGPNFEKLLNDAARADQLWSEVESHVTKCSAAFQNGFDPLERDFFAKLIPWVNAVKQTTSLLRRQQQALLDKLRGQPLSIKEYQKLEQDYQESVENYLHLGQSLQPLIDKLFVEPK